MAHWQRQAEREIGRRERERRKRGREQRDRDDIAHCEVERENQPVDGLPDAERKRKPVCSTY